MAKLASECPRCESREVWGSRAGWVKYLAKLIRLHPVRCGQCGTRYWGFGWDAPPRRPAVSRRNSSWSMKRLPSSTTTRPVAVRPKSSAASSPAHVEPSH